MTGEYTSYTVDGEELDVYEARQFNKKYDNDYNLTSYTAEMRYNDNDRFFSFLDFEGSEGSIKFCPNCEEYGFHHKLYAKIREKGEKPQPGDDLFGSCHHCLRTFPLYQATPEPTIKDTLEKTENPFEEQGEIFLSVGKRRLKKNRLNDYEDDDPDIAAEIRRHGESNVHIIE